MTPSTMDNSILPEVAALAMLLDQQLVWLRATQLAKSPLKYNRAVAALRRVNDKITDLTGERPKKPKL